MPGVSVPGVEPQVQREEGETQPLVLLHVPELMAPQRVGRRAGEDHDAPEGDRHVVATREHPVREAAVAHVEEASVAKTRTREREPAKDMADRVRVVRDELAR
jgi:hypothetical protein